MNPLEDGSTTAVARVLNDRVCRGPWRPQLQKGDRDSNFLANAVYTEALKANGIQLQTVNRGAASRRENKAGPAIRHLKRITRKLVTGDTSGAVRFRSFHAFAAPAVEAANRQSGAEARVYGLRPALVAGEGDRVSLRQTSIGDAERDAARAAWWATAAERRVTRALHAQRPGPDPETLKPQQRVWVHRKTTFGGAWVEAEVVGPVWEQGTTNASGIVVRVEHKLLTVPPYQVRI